MQIIDNISQLLGDDLKQALKPGAKLKVAASCFSMYAYEALKAELEKIEELNFIFTSPTFVAEDVTDKIRRERREFHIPKLERERSLYGSEFEIQLRNKLTQRAVARECADWLRRKAKFKSNHSKSPMQQFACVQTDASNAAYMPLHGFTAVDLGYQQGNAVSNFVNKVDEPLLTHQYLNLFEQIWNDPEKLEDVTAQICEHIASVYQENSPESIYLLMLYNIFNEFLDDMSEDVLPNDRIGYQDTLIWNKLFNYQKDAATGIINKLETYSGCILADSVGLGKTFTALAVIKYYELRNKSVLVLCPKKLADNWLNYNRNLKTKGKLRQADREKSLQALMTVNLLKRLESSVAAFRLTLELLRKNHVRTLDKIVNFLQVGGSQSIGDSTDVLDDLEAEDDELLDVEQDTDIGGKIKINLADMDLPRWQFDLNQDLEHIEELLDAMQRITAEHDAKLQHLKSHVLAKIDNPINPGNKKVLIFTAFADTANYLYEQLAPDLREKKQLHVGKVTGTGLPKSTLGKGYDFQEVLTLFSPRSKEKAIVLPQEPAEIDILIGTDCISEGQNLQDCDYLINYDIHWNPVRIIQRFGRVDRIGSQNARIQLVNYWPDISLDEYIRLKERVENRMMIADVAATGDDNVLSAQANDVAYRKEQLRRLQEEVIELEDLKTGVSITDLGLNDFRMDLLNYTKAHGDLGNAPNGLHAIVAANTELGLHPGVIFTLRNRNSGINPSAGLPQHNRLHPYYLVYVGNDGHIIHDHTEVKRLLDLARTSCKGQTTPIAELYQRFNKATADGRNMQAYSSLLSKAIASMIEVKEEKDIDSLFSGGKTTALTQSISGLDDFELISFLVVQETV